MKEPITKEDYQHRIELHEQALAWVLSNFNTFKQPPDNLKGIVDAACLRSMTADAEMCAATESALEMANDQ